MLSVFFNNPPNVDANKKISVCKVKIVYIGKNLACTKIPEGYTDVNMLSTIKYDYGEIDGTRVRTGATIKLDSVTNIGTPIVTDTFGLDTASLSIDDQQMQFVDDDSIEIITTYFVGFISESKVIISFNFPESQKSCSCWWTFVASCRIISQFH